MSQKRMKGAPTRADGMVMTYREAIFAVINAASKVMAASIDASFEKTKYGSRRNGFFKRNYQYFEELAQSPLAAASNAFTGTLRSFGLQTGQTIVAGLQAGIIDTSALEMAMSASYDNESYGFMAFAVWSENTETQAKYVRADIGNLIVATANDVWSITDDDYTSPHISSFIGTTEGTGSDMKLVSFSVRGINLQELIGNAVVKNYSLVTTLEGTWSADGNTYTLTNARSIPVDSHVNYNLVYKDKVIGTTTVYGSTSGGGEVGE